MRRRRWCFSAALLQGACRKESALPHRVEMVWVAAVATIELPGPRTIPFHHPAHVETVCCTIGTAQVAAHARVFATQLSSLRSWGL